jgi:hypothetical protein
MSSMRSQIEFGAVRSRNWMKTLNQTIAVPTDNPEGSADREWSERDPPDLRQLSPAQREVIDLVITMKAVAEVSEVVNATKNRQDARVLRTQAAPIPACGQGHRHGVRVTHVVHLTGNDLDSQQRT